MINFIIEAGRLYFIRTVIFAMIIFLITTVSTLVNAANPKIVRLSHEELAALNVPQKCKKLGLAIDPQNNAIELSGVGKFALHNIINSDPSKLVFGIVNLNYQGKRYEVAMNQTGKDSWSVTTVIYGSQANLELKFSATKEEKIIKIKLASDGIEYKSKQYKEIEFICEL
jgi:hypothetical protein